MSCLYPGKGFGLFVCLLCFFGGKKPGQENSAESKGSGWTTCSSSHRSLPCSRFAHDCNFYVHRSQNSQYCSEQTREKSRVRSRTSIFDLNLWTTRSKGTLLLPPDFPPEQEPEPEPELESKPLPVQESQGEKVRQQRWNCSQPLIQINCCCF